MSYGTKNSVEKVARLLLAAVAAAITVYCLATASARVTPARTPGVQAMDVRQVAGGAQPTSDRVRMTGRLMRSNAVRNTSRRTRSGEYVSGSEQAAFYLPVVPEGWTRSQPVHVFVLTPPSGYNINAEQSIEDAPSYEGLAATLPDGVREIFVTEGALRVADRAVVVDMTPGATSATSASGDVIGRVLGAIVAGMLAFWFAATGLTGAPAPGTALYYRIRRARRAGARGLFGAIFVLWMFPLLILGNDPELAGWIGIGIFCLVIAACLYLAVLNLRCDVPAEMYIETAARRMNTTLEGLAHALDRELGGAPLKDKELRLLPTWLCSTSGPTALVLYEDIAWVYRTQVGAQILIVVERVVEFEEKGVRTSQLSRIEHPVTAVEANLLLTAIAQRTPWATHGWNMQLEANRPNVLHEFEQRRAATQRRPIG
jgi:hypothetical protein